MILFVDFALYNLGCNIHGDTGNLVLEFVHGLLLFLLDLRLCLLAQAGSISLRRSHDFVIMRLCLAAGSLSDVRSLCLGIADALFIFVAQLFRTGLCGLSIGIRLVNLCLTCVQNILYGFEKKVFEQQEQQQQVDQLCNNFPWYDGNQI